MYAYQAYIVHGGDYGGSCDVYMHSSAIGLFLSHRLWGFIQFPENTYILFITMEYTRNSLIKSFNLLKLPTFILCLRTCYK